MKDDYRNESLSEERKLESPCIRNCCLDDDDICLGCFRTLDEIRGWASSNREERQSILDKCQQRKLTRKNWRADFW